MKTDAIIAEAIRIIRCELPEKSWKIFLFGSQAEGSAHETSDIDIGILGPCSAPVASLAAIREAIEKIPTLRSIDVVDLRSMSSRFQKHALEKALILQ